MWYIRVIGLVLLWCFTMGHTACEPTYNTYEYAPYYYQHYSHYPRHDNYFHRDWWWNQKHPPGFWKDFQRCRSWQSHAYCKRKMYLKWRFDH